MKLVNLVLPASLSACDVIGRAPDGSCVVRVNDQVHDRFAAAVAEIDARGLGPFVTAFGTVNRRRCRNAVTGNYLAKCISKHSYGIAADVRAFEDNANWASVVRNEPNVQTMIDVFRSHGFTWGMTFGNNPDPQHVEWTP